MAQHVADAGELVVLWGINNHNLLCVIIYEYLTETLHLKESYFESNQLKYQIHFIHCWYKSLRFTLLHTYMQL